MKYETRELRGRVLLSISAIATAVTAFVFDRTASHLFNPTWPNLRISTTQTMFLVFGFCGVGFIAPRVMRDIVDNHTSLMELVEVGQGNPPCCR